MSDTPLSTNPAGMSLTTPTFNDRPNDTIPGNQKQPNIDEDHLRGYILEILQNDIMDKQEFAWVEKRQYDIKAYYGLKDIALSQWPWPNASNFPQPLTPTLLDTYHANLLASMYSKADQLCKVKGVGVEDVRKAKNLEQLLNWQTNNEMDMYSVQDANAFRTGLHGTGCVKVMQDFEKNQVIPRSIDIENIFVPIDARGFQPDDTDHVIQMIPLTYNDLQYRKGLKVYKNLDEIPAGFSISNDLTKDQLTFLKDIVTGTSQTTRNRRDMYFLAECYLTYYPKDSTQALELIVWISPNGGRIQRVMVNEDKIRPFADYTIYPNHGRFYGMSLPEKIRNIQEKLDYADKQNTDALDRAISPAAFTDVANDFDADTAQRVPGGIYPITRGTNLTFEPTPPVERGFERQLDYLWDLGERLTGLTELFQGRTPDRKLTATTDTLRTNKSEIRFSTVFDRYERGWKKTLDLIYYYNSKFMPPDKKIKVLGYADFQTIEELFPKGMEGKYDFEFAGSPTTEIERQKQDDIAFCTAILADPAIQGDPASKWRLQEKLAQAHGIRDLDDLITRPAAANIMSPKEAIQRIVSGQYEVNPRPGIDYQSYIFEIGLFSKSQSYQALDPQGKAALQKLLMLVQGMQSSANQAMLDLQTVQHGNMLAASQSVAQGMGAGGPQQGPAPMPQAPGVQ